MFNSLDDGLDENSKDYRQKVRQIQAILKN